MSGRRSRETAVCGMHIGAHEIRMAKIQRSADGSQRLVLDQASASERAGGGVEWLAEAIEQLVSRHHLRRVDLAVTFDGDYCVTRVTTGTPDEVDRGLQMLNTRVPRYLSLGPGEKITGGYRISLNKQRDYAVTGVANRRLVEGLQQVFADNDLRPRSLEPTLVAVARMMRRMPGMEAPVLLVDGSGTQWDVGIAHEGRLLLDYRPSGARHSERFSAILAGHMARLHRFCERHRQMERSELRDLYIFGPKAKVDGARESFEGQSAMRVRRLIPAETLDGMDVPAEAHETCWVGAVAAALTLNDDASGVQVADLLSSVRFDRESTPMVRWAWTLLPAVLAASLLIGLFGTVHRQRGRAADAAGEKVVLEKQIREMRAAMAATEEQQYWLGGLRTIERVVQQTETSPRLFEWVPRVLPDAAKLNRMVVADDGTVRLSGTAMDETTIYDVVAGLRTVPGVRDVVLQGTTPVARLDSNETEFVILMKMDRGQAPREA